MEEMHRSSKNHTAFNKSALKPPRRGVPSACRNGKKLVCDKSIYLQSCAMVWRHIRALSTSSSTLTPARVKSSDNKMPEKLACMPRFTASRIKENLALAKQKD